MGYQKNQRKSIFASTFITLLIVAMLLFSGPAQAVSVMISGLHDKYTQGTDVKFQIKIDINSVDRFVPVKNVSLDVAGPIKKSSTFLLDGTQIIGDGNITIDAVSIPKSADFGYGYGYGYDYGYGYGYDFGYGYGYGYGYGGYGYGGGGGKLTYIYNVTVKTTYFPLGSYTVVAHLNTGNEVKPSFDSAPATFEIIPAIIPATVRIEPETLNLASGGVFTAFIELPSPYNVSNISTSTIITEGAHAIEGTPSANKFIAKFNVRDLVNVPTGDAVKFTVTGALIDGTPFEGSDTIRVISRGTGGQSPSGGGSTGTGGLGVSSPEPFDNIEECGGMKGERKEKYLLADAAVTYPFTPCEGGVYEIVVIGKENEKDISLKVEHLHGLSKLLSRPAPEKVYYYLNVWSGTKRIKEAIIRFKVENPWLAENNIASGDVKMSKWVGTEWATLDTREIRKDATHTYFEARTDGFSHFAVRGAKGAVQTPPQITPAGTPGGTATPEATIIPGEKAPQAINMTLIIGVFILILIVTAVLYIARKK